MIDSDCNPHRVIPANKKQNSEYRISKDEQLKSNHLKKYVAFATACAVLVFAVMFTIHFAKDVAAHKKDDSMIFVNELSEPFNNSAFPPLLLLDDFRPMNQEELCEFYGTDVFLLNCLFDLAISNNGQWGIYENKTGGTKIYWDVNDIIYGDSLSRYMCISVSKNRTWTWADFYYKGSPHKNSTINGIEIAIGRYKWAVDDEQYFAIFSYKGSDYLITSRKVTETEFINMISSAIVK